MRRAFGVFISIGFVLGINLTPIPVNSVKELIEYAKAKPGTLNFATTGAGSANSLAPELFKAMTGTNIVRVNFKGSGPAAVSLLAGEVQLAIDTGASLLPHVKGSKLRALAVASPQPSPLFQGLPTLAATVPGYEASLLIVVLAPAKTPSAIISRLNHEIVRIMNQTDVKEKFMGVGIEVVGSTPAMLAATMKSDILKWSKVIKDAGIRAD